MTLIWLVMWLIGGSPSVHLNGDSNNWAVALLVCLAIDILTTIRRLGDRR